jgi:two-component system LytT family response regulator
MRSLIIDDEPRSRQVLIHLCDTHCPEVEVVGEAGSVNEGIDKIDRLKPDLVFLDIHMPIKSGFALLDHYKEDPDFAVIFTTAYEEYALDSFKYLAFGYLEKPINIEELQAAVQKVHLSYSNRPGTKTSLQEGFEDKVQKIALATLDSYAFVRFDDIIRCEGEGSYTKVFLKNNESLLITKTLKHYEDMLLSKSFFRVHKSHLINLKLVRKFIRGKKGMVEMVNGDQVEVSSQKRDQLLDLLLQIN